jgi:hypothetical protein
MVDFTGSGLRSADCGCGLRMRIADTDYGCGLRMRIADYGLRMRIADADCGCGLRMRITDADCGSFISSEKSHNNCL